MKLRTRSFASILVAASLLAACSGSPLAPADAPQVSPSLLIGPNGEAFFADSVDAYGNTILIQEFAAGVEQNAAGDFVPVASVTVRTFIPYAPGGLGSGSCITSTILRTEAVPGNTLSVKKAGGCDKDIEVAIEQKATKKKAVFRFSMKAGKTVIDSGLLK